mmetsp:Transcript_9811/g.32837  ORF Transcript_9811/g.32837 Transcript_9811/m.32837 type:complete len:226 (-) Transcript_9811:1818-2495(-)
MQLKAPCLYRSHEVDLVMVLQPRLLLSIRLLHLPRLLLCFLAGLGALVHVVVDDRTSPARPRESVQHRGDLEGGDSPDTSRTPCLHLPHKHVAFLADSVEVAVTRSPAHVYHGGRMSDEAEEELARARRFRFLDLVGRKLGRRRDDPYRVVERESTEGERVSEIRVGSCSELNNPGDRAHMLLQRALQDALVQVPEHDAAVLRPRHQQTLSRDPHHGQDSSLVAA